MFRPLPAPPPLPLAPRALVKFADYSDRLSHFKAEEETIEIIYVLLSFHKSDTTNGTKRRSISLSLSRSLSLGGEGLLFSLSTPV